MKHPNGTIMHAEHGNCHVMISEATDQHPAMQCMVHVYVPNVDAVFQRAVAAGGKSTMEPMDQFYGDRDGAREGPVRQSLAHLKLARKMWRRPN